MVYVPGGDFMMGRDDGDEYERPAHNVTVKPFFIDVHEVTYRDYEKFTGATGYHVPPGLVDRLLDQKDSKASGRPDPWAQKPVSGITWDDANAYARWAGKRLPTEEEWEFAARGTDGRRYPWGNEWQGDRANANSAKTDLANVGSSKGVSPFGLYDMVGNAWEWTASSLTTYPGGQLPIKPTEEMRVIRGGAYDSDQSTATATYRRGYPARGNYDYSKTGFRCAKDVN
jgi:serine/threonine-protein kinase